MTDPGEKKQGPQIKFTFQGDTSTWDAKKQLLVAKTIIELLEMLDIDKHGKKTVDWVITEMTKDD